MTQISIDLYQISLFFHPDFIANYDTVYAELTAKKSIYNNSSNNSILPIPPSAPAEIPRIILQNTTKTHELHIMKSRINFFWYNRNAESERDKFNLKISNIFQDMQIIKKIINANPIIRIGVARKIYFDTTDYIAEFSQKIITNKKLQPPDLEKILVRFSYMSKVRIESKDVLSNRVVTIDSGYLLEDTNHRVILITVDDNTQQNETLNLNLNSIRDYIKKSLNKSNESIYRDYFNE